MTARLPLGERLYRVLLRLYPSEFRARYRDDMLDFYRDRVQAAADARTSRWRLWFRLVADVASAAIAERFDWRSRRRSATHPDLSPREDSMGTLWQDVRFALRSMKRRPGFSAIVVATIALGIGANAAIFSVVNTVLLRPLPYRGVERIVDVAHQDPYWSVSEPEFVDYQRDVPAFAKLAAYNGNVATIGADADPVRARGARVSREFFNILGVSPVVGRVFAADEYAPESKTRIAVISHALWQQQFAGDSRIVGRVVAISGVPTTIIGVMPASFGFPNTTTAFWSPWRYDPDKLWTRNNHYLRLIAQLAPSATIEQAATQARTLDLQWAKDFPETYKAGDPLVAAVTPLRDYILGPTQPYLFALFGAVVFILLIACVNVANLFLVRGEGRRKEVAIRTALGASRDRIVRQMLTESMLYAVVGAALGVGVAWIGVRFLVLAAPANVPRLDELRVDGGVIAFTAALTILTGLLFGLVPALRMRADSAHTLRDGGKTSDSAGSHTARRVLVVTEVALAVVTLTGAGLLIRSLEKLRALDLGFDSANVLTMQLTLPPRGYTDTTADHLFEQILAGVRRLPGVRSAALDGELPFSGNDNGWSIVVDGRAIKTIAEAPSPRPDQVTAGYFATMGIRIVKGRAFAPTDRRGAAPVVVVNETMAKQLWPGVDPIGHTIRMFDPKAPWATVVGVAANVRVRGFQAEIPSTMYFPYSQSGMSAYYQPTTMTLVVKTQGKPSSFVSSVRGVVRAAEARMPISQVLSMDDVVGQSIEQRTFTTSLLGAFALLALLLAGLGIYGVIAYSVSQRTYEIGVRIALGASTGSVMRLVAREGVRMTIVGLAIGLAGSVAVLRLLRALLVGVNTIDGPTWIAVTLLLGMVAACACALPAHRATAVSPTEALRNG